MTAQGGTSRLTIALVCFLPSAYFLIERFSTSKWAG
jgi:hypothetical protein